MGGPVYGRAGDGPIEYEGEPTTAPLAVARVTDFRVPIVLACGRFSDASAAAERMDVSVVRIDT